LFFEAVIHITQIANGTLYILLKLTCVVSLTTHILSSDSIGLRLEYAQTRREIMYFYEESSTTIQSIT
jgi:hypothetical protein